jgi:hypothetical protein
LGKRKRYFVEYLCHVDGLPCSNYNLDLAVGVCELNGVVCSRFTVKNADHILEFDFRW